MAYPATGHPTRINFFSNPDVKCTAGGVDCGTKERSDVARIITRNRSITEVEGGGRAKGVYLLF